VNTAADPQAHQSSEEKSNGEDNDVIASGG